MEYSRKHGEGAIVRCCALVITASAMNATHAAMVLIAVTLNL
ncbi:hypothetical protein ACO0LB_02910 [Undibacterium sp. SXout7W]